MKRLIPFCTAIAFLLIACEEEVPDPNFDLRDDYTGSWVVEENSNFFGAQAYAVEVTKSDTSDTEIWVSNFYGLGSSTITSMNVVDNSLVIPLQIVSGSDISGTGQSDLDVTGISFTYGVDDGSGVDNCTATWTR